MWGQQTALLLPLLSFMGLSTDIHISSQLCLFVAPEKLQKKANQFPAVAHTQGSRPTGQRAQLAF